MVGVSGVLMGAACVRVVGLDVFRGGVSGTVVFRWRSRLRLNALLCEGLCGLDVAVRECAVVHPLTRLLSRAGRVSELIDKVVIARIRIQRFTNSRGSFEPDRITTKEARSETKVKENGNKVRIRMLLTWKFPMCPVIIGRGGAQTQPAKPKQGVVA